MSEFKKGAASLLRSRGLYIALALCLVAAGTVGYLTTLQRPAVQTVVPEEVEVEIVRPPVTVPEIKKPLPAAPVIVPVEEETVPVSGPEELLPQVVSPLDGTTVTVFSMTELMYDDTMADWRTHNGLDIQAGEGDAVKTAAAGTVASVLNDEMMGTTVTIDHVGGFTTIYASLQKDPPVTAGQQVAAGDIIGRVGSTASAESSMGPHLHFSVYKDGELIDPSEYVAQ
ncbi:MAG: M23 family metallopeptidase [Oscillospiraceae bacterium]|nr:M23 family metallopeptidase [Oscillospiraceae bacterium]